MNLTLEKQATIVWNEYYAIDPSIDDASEQLAPIVEKLFDLPNEIGKLSVLRANVYYELAQMAKSNKTREWYVDLLSETVPRDTAKTDRLYPLCLHMPYIAHGWSKRTNEQFGRRLNSATSYNGLRLRNPRSYGSSVGRLSEQLVSGLANIGGITGLYALPAYSRQEASIQKVDGKNYNWDLTILSTGETVEAGEYRAQIKTSKATGNKQIHPEIVRINAKELFGMNALDCYEAKLIIDNLRGKSTDPSDVCQLKEARNKLKNCLHKTGPIRCN